MTQAVNESRFDVSGKVVVVTGAGRGLGQGIAVAFAAAGARVLTVSRTASELAQTSQLIAEVGPPAVDGDGLPSQPHRPGGGAGLVG